MSSSYRQGILPAVQRIKGIDGPNFNAWSDLPFRRILLIQSIYSNHTLPACKPLRLVQRPAPVRWLRPKDKISHNSLLLIAAFAPAVLSQSRQLPSLHQSHRSPRLSFLYEHRHPRTHLIAFSVREGPYPPLNLPRQLLPLEQSQRLRLGLHHCRLPGHCDLAVPYRK